MTAKAKDGIKLPLKKAKKHIMDMYTVNILNFKREQNVLSFFIKSQKLRYNKITNRKDIKMKTIFLSNNIITMEDNIHCNAH